MNAPKYFIDENTLVEAVHLLADWLENNLPEGVVLGENERTLLTDVLSQTLPEINIGVKYGWQEHLRKSMVKS